MCNISKISCFTILLTLAASAAAGQFHDGIHGMQWGNSYTQYQHLTKVRDQHPITYYVNSNMLYQVANQAVPGVVYGFYQGKLFAAYIKFQSPDQFHYMIEHFTNRLGEPKITFTSANRGSIYRWKDGDVKIKLKMKDSLPKIKMGIYYMPLSDKVNQERLENPPTEIFNKFPSENKKDIPPAENESVDKK